MMLNHSLTLATLFYLSIAKTAGESALWNYNQFGYDWQDLPIDGNKCGTTNQSPIDLKSKGWSIIDSKADNFNKIYTNQQGDVEIVWTGETSKIKVDKPG